MLTVARSIRSRVSTDLYYARGAQEVLPMRAGGVRNVIESTVSEALSVAGRGRLRLGVSIELLQ